MSKQRYSFTDALFSGGAGIGPNDGIMGLDQATIDAINLDNVRKAIARNINLDSQGDIQTFDVNDDLMNYNELMESDTTSRRGILDLLAQGGNKVLDFIGSGGIIGNVINSIGDMFQYRGAGPSITNTPLAQFAFRDQLRRNPNFNIGAALDRQNALGGYYSDFARGQRQLANRFSNLMDRARSGKNYSRGNLQGISRALGLNLSDSDITNIESGAYDISPGTFTAQSLSDSFASEEEGPVGGNTGSTSTMSASDFSDDTPGTPF